MDPICGVILTLIFCINRGMSSISISQLHLISHTVMETTTLYSSLLSSLPFSRQHQKTRFLCSKRLYGKVFASGRDSFRWDYAGRLVDESMIVLRKRVHEMKVIERNYEPPADWMEWEKQYYASYDELVCHLIGLLQRRLMNTRPSLALGIISLITMSVPASAFMIVLLLLQAANGVFSAGQLS